MNKLKMLEIVNRLGQENTCSLDDFIELLILVRLEMFCELDINDSPYVFTALNSLDTSVQFLKLAKEKHKKRSLEIQGTQKT